MAGFAWVTLATNDSYSLGALVLAHSLRRVGTKHDLAVLVTPGVTGAMREKLSTVFSLVQEVNVLDSKDEANLALLARPELGITFTKLHCWRLTQYEKCVFVDADTLVIRNCDELFDRDELSAAPDVGWPDCFNSGVFVFKPSQQTFASITSFAAAKGSFDGGDQGLLNQYFSDWARKDITKHLPFIYNMCSTATYSYLPAFKQFGEDVRIIHFIGITKPWLQYFDTITGQVQPAPGTNHLQPLLQLWWNIFCENVHPKLSPAMASSTLAQHWHEYNSNPSLSRAPKKLSHDSNDPDDSTYENIEPNFSEFQDPWENYEDTSNIIIHALNDPINNYTRPDNDNYNNLNNNDNREYSAKNDFKPFATFESTNCDHSNSQNHHSNWIYHREDHKVSSVLENIEYNEKHNDSHVFESREIDDSRSNLKNHDFHVYEDIQDFQIVDICTHNFKSCFVRNDEYNDVDETNKFVKIDEKHDDDDTIVINNQRINEIFHPKDNEKQQNHHHHYHHHENVKKLENETFLIEKIAKNEIIRNNDKQDRSKDQCLIEFSKAQTDSSSTISQSHPLPCTKSKSVTTQSEQNIARQLESNDDAGIAGALAKITLGEVRSPEQVAFEEHMRKQSWEQGQIDYMGRDSFDNIWKKISETLAVQPERESSPPKNSPKPEKSEIEEPTALPTEDEPAAKSEAAVPSETQRKAEQDPIDELAHELTKLPSKLTPEQMIDTMISAQSSLSDAAIANVALISKVPESSTAKTLESSSNDDSTIVESRGIREIEPKLDKDEGNIVMSRKNMEIESSRLSEVGSAEAIFPESQVPIQVAESVLEADVKESVSEDIRPVKEEAISSISLMAQESVPAVLETAMEASDPVGPVSNGSDDSSTGIGNGIDAPSFSSSTGLASATVAIVEGPLMPPVQDPQTPTIAQESSRDRREASSVLPAESVEALEEMKLVTEVQSPPLPVETPSQPPKTEILAEIQQSSTPLLAPAEEPEDSSEEPQRVLPAPPESTQEPPACAAIETVKSSPITLDPQLNSSPSQQLDPTLADSTDKPEESFVQSVGSVTAPIRSTEKLQEIKSPETASLDSTVKSVASTKIQMTASCAAKPAEQLEELSVKTKKSSIPTDPATLISVPAVSSIDKQTPADSSSPSTIETTESKEEIISSQSERTTEESSSSSSPVRPARTKEYQIPGTPTITEATPPTSPPIDVATAKSLEEPATTKVTKKIVKKIVKKTTSETRQPAAEGIEADADPEGKKVTKKIVKKVAKKKDEDGNGAESTSGSDKPKKIIKVAKKTTKTTLQTLDAEAPVPETPPPGTSEMPIPPKRKLKVTTKTTTQKSDSEP